MGIDWKIGHCGPNYLGTVLYPYQPENVGEAGKIELRRFR